MCVAVLFVKFEKFVVIKSMCCLHNHESDEFDECTVLFVRFEKFVVNKSYVVFV